MDKDVVVHLTRAIEELMAWMISLTIVFVLWQVTSEVRLWKMEGQIARLEAAIKNLPAPKSAGLTSLLESNLCAGKEDAIDIGRPEIARRYYGSKG